MRGAAVVILMLVVWAMLDVVIIVGLVGVAAVVVARGIAQGLGTPFSRAMDRARFNCHHSASRSDQLRFIVASRDPDIGRYAKWRARMELALRGE